ncbi:MAG: hypothetical protein AAB408_02295 [Patescibacteria group bacterium]
MNEQTIQQLILEYEGQIRSDAHTTRARASRSQAGKKILEMGCAALRDIVTHLKATQPRDEDWNMCTAWGFLLYWIAQGANLTGDTPDRLGDLAGWIAWAERHASNATAVYP